MRTYYEAREIVPFGEDSEFVRIDTTDMNVKEKEETLKEIRDVIKRSRVTEHTCNHDANEPCTEVEV